MHQHSHHPIKFNTAFAIAVGLNLTYTIVQAIYAILANSMSLLADAGHNLGDVAGLLLAWGANWLLTKGATEKFSYGYKRTTILAALANALLLVLTSTLIAYQSMQHLLNPEPIKETIVIVVALIGIVVNGGTALLFFEDRHHDLNVKGAFLHLLSDALISFSVVVTAIIIYYTDWHIADPIMGLLIVLTILYATWGLLRDSVNLILDAVPIHVDHQAVKLYLLSFPGVYGVHDLHIWGLSTQECALTVHLVMPDEVLSDGDHQKINQYLMEEFRINHVTIQVEKGSEEDPCGQRVIC